MNPSVLFLGAALACTAASLPARAEGADGVIVIDQAKAVAGSVTPGDAAGFPVTINQPGSYRLGSNLSVAAEGVHAIDIVVNGVSLDLNGFTIQGPISCTGGTAEAIACPAGNVNGVGVRAANRRFVSVRNGAVRGFGYGVRGAYQSRFENLDVAHSGMFGIIAGEGSLIANSIVFMSYEAGIHSYGDVRNNHVSMSGYDGIRAALGSLVIGNRVDRSGWAGINGNLGGAPTLIDNSVTRAGQHAVANGVNAGGNTCNGQLCP